MESANIGGDIRPKSGANGIGDGAPGGSAGATIDPRQIDTANARNGSGSAGSGDGDGASVKRRRGRPPGSGNAGRKSKASVPVDLSGLTGILLFAHKLAADASKNPELELTDDDAKAYQTALENVLRHYDVKVTQKALDHAALVMTLGGIYGVRLTAIALRKKAEAVAPKYPQPRAGVVVPLMTPGIIPN